MGLIVRTTFTPIRASILNFYSYFVSIARRYVEVTCYHIGPLFAITTVIANCDSECRGNSFSLVRVYLITPS